MSDRVAIPLAVAATFGFLCGLIGSVLQLSGGAALAVAATAVIGSALAALSSVIGVRADGAELTIVALLRAGLAAALALFIYLGMLSFLRDGNPLLAVVLWAFAGGIALLIPRVLVRSRPARREHRGQQTA